MSALAQFKHKNLSVYQVSMMKYWLDVCLLLANGHKIQSEHCVKWKNIFTVINITASVAVLFISSSNDAKRLMSEIFSIVVAKIIDPKISSIVTVAATGDLLTGIFGMIVVVTSMLQFFLRYEERHIEHRNFSSEYFNLYKKIDRHIRDERTNSDDLHSINKQINYTTKFATSPPDRVLTSYEKRNRVFNILGSESNDNELKMALARIRDYHRKNGYKEDIVDGLESV